MKPRRTIKSLITSCLSAAVICASAASAVAATVDDIVEAWKRREQATRSFSAETWELGTAAKGTLSLASKSHGPETVIPAEDHDRVIERTLVIDGDRMRHVRVGDAWDDAADRFVPETMTSVCNGIFAKSLHRSEHAGEARSVGFIHQRANPPDRFCLYLGALLKHFRPFSAGLGTFKPEQWELIDPSATVNNTKCLLVLEGKLTDARYSELYIDPEKDFALVRYCSRFHGRLENELTTTFVKDTKLGWIPDSWEVTRYAKGRLLDCALGSLKDIQVNEPAPESAFALTFSAGTEVNDRLDSKVSHVLPNGEWLTITPHGRKAASQFNKASDEGRAGVSSFAYLPAVLVLSIVALSLALLRRRVGRIASGIALLIGLSLVLDTETKMNFSFESVAHGACGDGCSAVACFEGTDGTYIVIEDGCHKILRMDPGNASTLGGASFTSRFEVVDADIGCSPSGGLGGMAINCPGPTGNWAVAGTACREWCDDI